MVSSLISMFDSVACITGVGSSCIIHEHGIKVVSHIHWIFGGIDVAPVNGVPGITVVAFVKRVSGVNGLSGIDRVCLY